MGRGVCAQSTRSHPSTAHRNRPGRDTNLLGLPSGDRRAFAPDACAFSVSVLTGRDCAVSPVDLSCWQPPLYGRPADHVDPHHRDDAALPAATPLPPLHLQPVGQPRPSRLTSGCTGAVALHRPLQRSVVVGEATDRRQPGRHAERVTFSSGYSLQRGAALEDLDMGGGGELSLKVTGDQSLGLVTVLEGVLRVRWATAARPRGGGRGRHRPGRGSRLSGRR